MAARKIDFAIAQVEDGLRSKVRFGVCTLVRLYSRPASGGSCVSRGSSPRRSRPGEGAPCRARSRTAWGRSSPCSGPLRRGSARSVPCDCAGRRGSPSRCAAVADLVEALAHRFEAPASAPLLRLGENTTRWFAPNSFRKVMAVRALAITSARRAGSCVGPLKEMVTMWHPRLSSFLLHLGGGDAVGLEDLRKLRDAQADEAGILHDVQDVGEGHAREVVPEVGAQRPSNVLVGGQPPGGARQGGPEKCQCGAACHSQ